MTIKDFTVGQTVFLLSENKGRTGSPVITERTVAKIGRKYVTLNGVWEEKFEDCGSEYLIEHTNFAKRYLFSDRNALEAFLERKQLVRWFVTLNDTKLKECTLEQLKKAKEILTYSYI